MIDRLKIQNFRCFKDFSIGPMSRINLFSGKNNVGKTALLEALWLLRGYDNPEVGIRIDGFRGIDRFKLEELMKTLFRFFDQKDPIKISADSPQNHVRELTISAREQRTTRISMAGEELDGDKTKFSAPGIAAEAVNRKNRTEISFDFIDPGGNKTTSTAYIDKNEIQFVKADRPAKNPGVFLPAGMREDQNTLAERFSDLALEKKQRKVIDVLKNVEPCLKDLTIQVRAHGPMIFADIGKDKLMPLPLLGDGISRLMSIVLAIPMAGDGILLVDEIENGLHWSVMTDIWRSIAQLAHHYNTQIFAATHSWECISSFQEALSALAQSEITGALFRLERKNGEIRTVPYTIEDLAISVEQEIEVR